MSVTRVDTQLPVQRVGCRDVRRKMLRRSAQKLVVNVQGMELAHYRTIHSIDGWMYREADGETQFDFHEPCAVECVGTFRLKEADMDVCHDRVTF